MWRSYYSDKVTTISLIPLFYAAYLVKDSCISLHWFLSRYDDNLWLSILNFVLIDKANFVYIGKFTFFDQIESELMYTG